ncbi:MAG TPA: ParB N-terminal domain-containing protein, partial [Planctomycetota bacterium]|nr:ParB N-terminal domain-containing protein [Planctomycetota bacterium]
MIGEDREGEPRRIPVARLRPRGFPGRAGAGDADVAALAASIRAHGLLHPIVVRPAGRDFEVVCGQRRLDACRALGWGEIPALVRSLDDRHAVEAALAENARRAPLS